MHPNAQTASPPRSVGGAESARLALVVGALGVVFGDIGTSPIYTIQTVFNPADPHPVPISTDNVYGVVSLIFWSVMIIVTLTYVTRKEVRAVGLEPTSSFEHRHLKPACLPVSPRPQRADRTASVLSELVGGASYLDGRHPTEGQTCGLRKNSMRCSASSLLA